MHHTPAIVTKIYVNRIVVAGHAERRLDGSSRMGRAPFEDTPRIDKGSRARRFAVPSEKLGCN